MDQKCPFLGSKEIGSKFLENKTKKAQNKQKTNNNKTNQKTPTENNLQCTLDIHSVTSHSARGCLEDVPSSFLSPDLSCVLFFWKEAFPSFILPVSPTVLTGHSSPSLPSGRESPPRKFLGEGTPLLAVVLAVLGLLHWTVCSGTALCNQKANQRILSCSFGKPWAASINCMPANYEVSRSGIGSREVRQFSFCFSAVTFLGLFWAAVRAGMHLMWRTPMLYSQKSRKKKTPWPISHSASQDTH